MFEKIFKLSENKTSVKTELVAGLTTFMTMAYIIALNPNLLTNFGAVIYIALADGCGLCRVVCCCSFLINKRNAAYC